MYKRQVEHDVNFRSDKVVHSTHVRKKLVHGIWPDEDVQILDLRLLNKSLADALRKS